MTLDKEKLRTNYLNDLSEGYRDLEKLDAEDRVFFVDTAKLYYKYLASNGIAYGKLALEVVEDRGSYGQYANIHLKAQSSFDGISPEHIAAVREKIIISLAYRDAQMRVESEGAGVPEELKSIKQYHIAEFTKHSTPYAWGGLVLDEIVGNGSWMELYEQDAGFIDGIHEIIKSKAGGVREGKYSHERMLQAASHSFKVLHTHIDSEFNPTIIAVSKEMAASIFGVDISRVEEIQEDRSMNDSGMVASKLFRIKPSAEFASADHDEEGLKTKASKDSSREKAGGEDLESGLSGANPVIDELLKDPVRLRELQEKSMQEALDGLRQAEHEFPGLGLGSLATQSMSLAREVRDLCMQGASSVSTDTSFIGTNQFSRARSEHDAWAEELAASTQAGLRALWQDPEHMDFLASLMGTNGLGGNS